MKPMKKSTSYQVFSTTPTVSYMVRKDGRDVHDEDEDGDLCDVPPAQEVPCKPPPQRGGTSEICGRPPVADLGSSNVSVTATTEQKGKQPPVGSANMSKPESNDEQLFELE
jgi:hypothetical protein